MSETKIVELVEEAKKPGIFNIIDVINERAYPRDEINVYLNESAAYKASLLDAKLKKTDPKDKEYSAIEKELNKFIDELEQSKYVFCITGISEGKRDELYKIASDKYSVEYREDKNPFTGEIKREEIPNDDRDNLFTSLIWSAHIEKIIAPDGNVQESISAEDVDKLRKSLPIACVSTINQAIELIRTSTAVFMYKVDEDFLAKS
jgi:hypothetical protein